MHRFRAFASFHVSSWQLRPGLSRVAACRPAGAGECDQCRQAGRQRPGSSPSTSPLSTPSRRFSANDGTFILLLSRRPFTGIIAVKSGFLPAVAMILPTQKDSEDRHPVRQPETGQREDPTSHLGECVPRSP